MRDRKAPFGFRTGVLLTVVIATGRSVTLCAQDPLPAVPFRADADPQESKLMARTDLVIDQLPRKLAVKKLSELHGLRIKLDEEALAAAGVKLDVPVTASFTNYTLRAALFHVLGNDDLHFEFNGKFLTVTTAPPDAPGAAPPPRLIRLPARNDARRPGFQLQVVRMPDGLTAVAQINGVWIQCAPAQDLDVAEAAPREGDAPPRKMQISFDPGIIGQVVFRRDRTADAAEYRLISLLDRRIGAVDRICHLSDRQREKLRLAGRGDVKRLLDRAAGIQARLEDPAGVSDVDEFVKWARALFDDAEALRLDLETGSFDAKSLFAKALKRTLTPEQSATYSAGPSAEQ